MMTLLKLAAAGAAGHALYRAMNRAQPQCAPVAFADGEGPQGGFRQVRNAGPEAMRSDPPRWDRVDEASDESFPASDPPTTL